MKIKSILAVLASFLLSAGPASALTSTSDPTFFLRWGADQKKAHHIAGPIYKATGWSNTILVETDDGNVIIDASLGMNAARHKNLLGAINDKPVTHVIITHGHGDHIGGLGAWLEGGAKFVAQENIVEFLHYQERLKGFFTRRNAAQFSFPLNEANANANPGNYAAAIPEGDFFADSYSFDQGGLTFELLHTPSETYDALTVWIPELEAAFTGDLYYESFPNIYTLRGTQPRWALDYVKSLDRVIALEPKLLVPSHGEPVKGREKIRKVLTQYRDAILYVHDAVVAGMNEGKDVATLMREIRLPPELDVGERYGRIDWSVRGIYEGYAGWFDGEAANMYPGGMEDAASDLVSLAGGADGVAERAREKFAQGDAVSALRLANAALAAAPESRSALEARLTALKSLVQAKRNFNETGWLTSAAQETERRLAPEE